MARILAIDDDRSILESLMLYLEGEGHTVITVTEGTQVLELIAQHHPDVMIVDLRMPGIDGFEVLARLRDLDDYLPVIMITAYDDMEHAIRATSLGAFDFIPKPIDIELLDRVLQNALECRRGSREDAVIHLREHPGAAVENHLIGKSSRMRTVFRQIGNVANNMVTVLIHGESGTGKELIAHVVHRNSNNSAEPFIAVNCSALPEGLLESELFGHVRGAFTGAIRTKKGKFELAGSGTIFLDEISELSLGLQSKLLRVLQEREFDPVGGEDCIPMRARIIASTNVCLEERVRNKEFREDLYYRLNVYRIDVPPLRERPEDIPALVEYFISRFRHEHGIAVRKITRAAQQMLSDNSWPGNVRELEHTLLQAALRVNGDVLTEEFISLPKPPDPPQKWEPEWLPLSLEEIERMHIGRVLAHTGWNKRAACRILGISKPTLYSKIREYSIEPTEKTHPPSSAQPDPAE
jgi:two-component system response regulator AtoC